MKTNNKEAEKMLEIEIKEAMGKRIAQIFSTDEFSKTKIAEELDCTYDLINKWSKGESFPGHMKLIKFCERTGVSIDYILTGKTVVDPVKDRSLEVDIYEYRERILELKETIAFLKKDIKRLENDKLGEACTVCKK